MSDWWFTVDEVARMFGVSVPYVRKMASMHQWRRRRRGANVEYQYDDVSAWNKTRRPEVVTTM